MPRSISMDSPIECDKESGNYTASGDCSDPTRVYAELRGTDPGGGPAVNTAIVPVVKDGGMRWHVDFAKADLLKGYNYDVYASLADGQSPPVNDTEPVPPCDLC